MNKKHLTDKELRAALRTSIAASGGQAKWAAEANVSQSYVSDVLSGRRDPGETICRALGYERQQVYVRKDIWEEKESK